MSYIIYAKDKPNSTLRAKHRGAHLEFVATCRKVFLYGGPMLDEGGRVVGSLMVLDLPDRATLDAHMARDPYFADGGIFGSVEIFESRQIVPEVTPGSLDAELARQRAAEAAAAK
jgi:uncharacterized protein YciI